jgi:hypothetical protein
MRDNPSLAIARESVPDWDTSQYYERACIPLQNIFVADEMGLDVALARLDGKAIVSWDAFHTACAREFGFPDFYGRNGNAWIDCLSYISEGDGMSRFVLEPDELLRIEVAGSEVFRKRAPEIVQALSDWTASVNDRSVAAGGSPRLQLVFL